jgi:hypothetical protein
MYSCNTSSAAKHGTVVQCGRIDAPIGIELRGPGLERSGEGVLDRELDGVAGYGRLLPQMTGADFLSCCRPSIPSISSDCVRLFLYPILKESAL